MARRYSSSLILCATFILFDLASAEWPGAGGWGDGDWNGRGNQWVDGDNDNNNANGGYTADATNGFGLGSLEGFNRASKILIAHAVMASLVWV
jgi:hypothetical protein